MAHIEDFEKRYVSTVVFNEGDKILVTEENIEPLRKALKHTNFHWMSGHQIVDGKSFQVTEFFIFMKDVHLTHLFRVSNLKKMMVSMLSTISLLIIKGALWLN